jgi:hypothetical protein
VLVSTSTSLVSWTWASAWTLMMWEIAFRSFQEDTVGDQDLEDAGVGVAAGVVAVDVDAVENRSVPRKKVTGDEKE